MGDAAPAAAAAAATAAAATAARVLTLTAQLASVGVSLVDATPAELAFLTVQDVDMHAHWAPRHAVVEAAIGSVQLDNQLLSSGLPTCVLAPASKVSGAGREAAGEGEGEGEGEEARVLQVKVAMTPQRARELVEVRELEVL
ncbi:hypothetical protein, partial [Brevundimonas sp.]|uniref:hypothetical protein n=1 Tax=Brevundimonas sp. TaxID=1871086 RepID=UPI003918E427